MKTFISIVFLLTAFYSQSQELVKFPEGVKISHDNGEVAREGRHYSFTGVNESFNTLENIYFGFNHENKELACVNGKDLPPFECKDFFIDNYNFSGNALYLYSKTIISCKIDYQFEDTEVDIRLKIIATDVFGEPIDFIKKENLLVLPIIGDFDLYVVMEMFYNLEGETEVEWKPVLDLFDYLPTNPKYLIFTSFEESSLQFYNFEN
jgi:hypothetical protein